MIKSTRVVIFIGLMLPLFSCSTSKVSGEKKEWKETVVYYSPTHIGGARTYMPMTEKIIRTRKHKKINSPRLYKEIRSILNSSCSGGKPQDNMMILAQIDTGKIAIHQDGIITVNNKVCSNITN
ncbi:MAG: hypothetical protein DSZ21_01315 [Tenericutes bacterium]|nr:MAG: hypothetical protein DSZ21_01315 [Mycoplasmatota bacterium]